MEEEVYGLQNKQVAEPSKLVIGLIGQDRLELVLQSVECSVCLLYRDAAKEPSPDKVQSPILGELEMLNRRLAELLRNIDL